MALRVCLGCSTAYAVGLQSCPQCGSPTRNAIYDWEDDVVAKANSETGATLYVEEGQDVSDVPDGVRLVGPGAPVTEPEPESEPEPEPEPVPLVPVAEQKAAGVPPENVVTIAEQKAGTPPPELPDPPAAGDDEAP